MHTTQAYGPDAAYATRRIGSISKDVAEVAWTYSNLGPKSIAKGLAKGAIRR